jgi:hypothetical protein
LDPRAVVALVQSRPDLSVDRLMGELRRRFPFVSDADAVYVKFAVVGIAWGLEEQARRVLRVVCTEARKGHLRPLVFLFSCPDKKLSCPDKKLSCPDKKLSCPDKKTFLSGQETFLSGQDSFLSGQETILSGQDSFLSGQEKFLVRTRNFLVRTRNFLVLPTW